MSATADGGPAFPCEYIKYRVSEVGNQVVIMGQSEGMTLRDYFAGLAMQACATNPAGAEGFTFTERAAWAYQQADAMLAVREKP